MEEPSVDDKEMLERKLKHFFSSRMLDEEIHSQKEEQNSLKIEEILEQENEAYRQGLLHCRTKEETNRLAQTYMDYAVYGMSLIESNLTISEERKQEYTLYKDAKIAALENITQAFMESDTYKALPTDAEYQEKMGELPPAIEYGESQDLENRKRDRGKMVYETFRQSQHERNSSLLDVRG